MKKRKIAIIGHFGGNENITDGQTVKTKILYQELNLKTDWKIVKIDTYYKNKRPLKLLINTLWTLVSVKDIIVLLSINGMKFYFPMLSWFAKHFGKNIYHDVIGGNLDKYVVSNNKFGIYLNSFRYNWVETNGLMKKLEKLGICNCDVIPNFKRLSILRNSDVKYSFDEPYNFCTFSRIIREKGIEDAINAIIKINEKYGRTLCRLDIYGPIGEEYNEEFNKIIDESPEYINYCGSILYDKSTGTIKDYFGLLFPSFWVGEGFPGTIVDAFSAGVPVIASDWNCNSEIVDNGINGLIFPGALANSLETAIMWSINNRDKFIEMRRNCINEAENYMPEKYIEKIKRVIEGK